MLCGSGAWGRARQIMNGAMKDLVAQPLGCKLHLSKTLVSVFEARIGAPNLGGVGFSEQSQYWCVPQSAA